jgi:diaminopimelate epimerase
MRTIQNLDIIDFLANFVYKSDGKIDTWRILDHGNYRGDCDDFALTFIYLASKKSLWHFWINLLTRKMSVMLCEHKGNPHVIVVVDDNDTLLWIDNITRTYNYFDEISSNYSIKMRVPSFAIAVKMLAGKILG